jgi:hypothetical protein
MSLEQPQVGASGRFPATSVLLSKSKLIPVWGHDTFKESGP